MANRTAECAFAIFASVVAGTPVTIVASSSARAATEDCLTEPQGQAPQGQHWYFRTEHASKQRCWYLRDLGDKAAQADASADIAAPSQSNEAAASLSTTDAYAELPTPRPRADQIGATSATRRAPANTSIAANVKDSATPSSTAPNDGVFGPPPILSGAVGTPGTSGAEDTSTMPEPEAVPALPAAAAPPQKEVGSLQMLLLVIFGALTLAGLSGSLVYRLGRARQTAQAAKRRREIWRSADIARRRASSTDKQPKNSAAAKQPRNSAAARADFAHRRDSSRANTRAGGVDDRRATGMDAGGVDDKVERVEAFLSQLSKLAESDGRSRPSRETRA
jgi:hypothetical protein